MARSSGATRRTRRSSIEGKHFRHKRDLARKLKKWEAEYNDDRPHLALKGQTPAERVRRTRSAIQTCKGSLLTNTDSVRKSFQCMSDVGLYQPRQFVVDGNAAIAVDLDPHSYSFCLTVVPSIGKCELFIVLQARDFVL